MKAPKCRTCGEHHRVGPCPQFQSSRGGGESRPPDLPSDGLGNAGRSARRVKTKVAGVATGPRKTKSKAENILNTVVNRSTKKPTGDGIAFLDPNAKSIASATRKIGRPRLEDRDKTLKAKMPWVPMGMSRSTWFRRQAEQRQKEKQ